MSLSSYRELKVWQLGIELSAMIYRATATYPKHELYGLSSQLRRATVSIPSNIAEGHSRASTKEYLHHISFTLGSLAEVETQLIISQHLGYLNLVDADGLLSACDRLGRMLHNLQRSLRLKLRRKPPQNGTDQ